MKSYLTGGGGDDVNESKGSFPKAVGGKINSPLSRQLQGWYEILRMNKKKIRQKHLKNLLELTTLRRLE